MTKPLSLSLGISYLSPPDEQKLKENLKQKHEHIRAQQASSPAFSSPLPNQGNQVSITKGPIQMSDENKEFQEDIWFVVSDIQVFQRMFNYLCSG